MAKSKPGLISHARWLTLCLTALVDYTRDPKPSKNKVLFAKYIQQVYVPTWFKIKCSSQMVDGARNMFFLIKAVNTQSDRVKNIAMKSVQTNAFFCPSSNLLVSMLADPDESIRQRAVNVILSLRHGDIEYKGELNGDLRVFEYQKSSGVLDHIQI